MRRPDTKPTLIAAAGLAALILAAPTAAQASVTCTYAGAPQNAMTVTVSGTSEAVIKRRGEEIVTMQRLEPAQACTGGVPTVTTTDAIHVVFSKSDLEEVVIELDGGPFAPGATPEADGAPEIEIDVTGETGLAANVVATSGDDQLRWVAMGDHPGLNLNPGKGDHDADVWVAAGPDDISTPLLTVDGGAGDDTIVGDATSRASASAYAYGGSGDDVLGTLGNGDADLYGEGGHDVITGGGFDDTLSGGDGHDRIDGRGGNDKIDGGRGADRISGGAGRDRIAAHDGSRDTIACGAGRDRANADRRDRATGCEQLARR